MRLSRSPSRAGRRASVVLFALTALASPASAAKLEILAPRPGDNVAAGIVIVAVRVTPDAGAPAPVPQVRVDGAGEAARGITVAPLDCAVRCELPVTVPAGRHTITVSASAAKGRAAPAPVSVTVVAAEAAAYANLHVLAAGVSEYRDPRLALAYPAKDATNFAAALQAQGGGGGLYGTVSTTVEVDKTATRARILADLDELRARARDGDVSVVFLAGHGIADRGVYHFLPADADLDNVATMIAQDELLARVHAVRGKVILFIDTCFAGALFRAVADRAPQPAALEPLVAKLKASDPGVAVFASSTAKQTSKESAAWRNGAFTRTLLDALGGGVARDQSPAAKEAQGGVIRLSALHAYLSAHVEALTGDAQTPTVSLPPEDWPFAVWPPPNAPPDAPRPPVSDDAQATWDRLFLGGIDKGPFVQGTFKRPLTNSELLDLVGRPDDARRVRARAGGRTALYTLGGLAIAAGLSVGLWGVIAGTINGDPNQTLAGALGGVVGGAVVGVSLIIGGASITVNPVPFTEMQQLATDYNRDLRKRLGLAIGGTF